MDGITWETPVLAPGRRSIELGSVAYEPGRLEVRVQEDPTGKLWSVRFSNIQGLRITTFESAFEVTKNLPGEGGFFEFKESSWLASLGAGKREYMHKARHFVICCYDEVLEIAAWEVSFVQEP